MFDDQHLQNDRDVHPRPPRSSAMRQKGQHAPPHTQQIDLYRNTASCIPQPSPLNGIDGRFRDQSSHHCSY